MRPGDTVYTPPDGWHWHNEAPDHFDAPRDVEALTDQAERRPRGANVTDDEYGYGTEGDQCTGTLGRGLRYRQSAWAPWGCPWAAANPATATTYLPSCCAVGKPA